MRISIYDRYSGNKLLAYLHAFLELQTPLTEGVADDIRELIKENPAWLNEQFGCKPGEYMPYEDFYTAMDIIFHKLADDDLLEFACHNGGLTSDQLRYVNDVSDKLYFIKVLLTSFDFLRDACAAELKAIGIKLIIPPYEQDKDIFYEKNRDNGFKSDLHFMTWASDNKEALIKSLNMEEVKTFLEHPRNFKYFCLELKEQGIIAIRTLAEPQLPQTGRQ